jgi:hypothetical protein
MALY